VPVQALQDVSVELHRHDVVGLIGPNGAGKSTLVNVITGFDFPDEGSVELAGRPITRWSSHRRVRAGIARSFQHSRSFRDLSVRENVEVAALGSGAGPREARRRADGLLDLLGLPDKATELPAVLSGGQRQRLAIARALANEPTLLLADEPTGALDSAGGFEVLELFRRLHAAGQTILLVTHDEHVADAAERVVQMQDGRVVGATTRAGRDRVGA
jgi:putative ABC transport system ATP-binding protein